eukprot:m.28696 g.28696  ORF g.28696 m.28696 type:complete len:159 (+) comp15957_c0_seq3:550-1026(+)
MHSGSVSPSMYGCFATFGLFTLFPVVEGGFDYECDNGVGYSLQTQQRGLSVVQDIERSLISRLTSETTLHAIIFALVVASAIQRLIIHQHQIIPLHAATMTVVSLGEIVVDLAWPAIRILGKQRSIDPFDGKLPMDNCVMAALPMVDSYALHPSAIQL